MTPSDRDEFDVLIVRMAETFQVQASDPMVDEYWEALVEYPLPEVRLAIKEATKVYDGFGMPKPVHIIRAMFSGDGTNSSPRRLALPETPPDPAVAKAALAEIRQIVDKVSEQCDMNKPKPAPFGEKAWQAGTIQQALAVIPNLDAEIEKHLAEVRRQQRRKRRG